MSEQAGQDRPVDPREEAERLIAAVFGSAQVAAEQLRGFATGSAECCLCPICRVIAAAREPSPEVAERIASGAADLASGLTGMLRTFARVAQPASTGRGAPDDSDPWRAATRGTAPQPPGPPQAAEPAAPAADVPAAPPTPPKPMAKKAVKPTPPPPDSEPAPEAGLSSEAGLPPEADAGPASGAGSAAEAGPPPDATPAPPPDAVPPDRTEGAG
jgi:hypothetical protein